jgi:hypothetical protein
LKRLSSSSTHLTWWSPPTRVSSLGCCKRMFHVLSCLKCCKHMFQVFRIFQRYVASVSYGCCKSRSRCCICCNGNTCMLQTSVLNVSFIFHVSCKCVYLDVAYVSYICCKRFIWMLHMLAVAFKCFSGVSNLYCKCFCFRHILQVFHLDVAKVDRVLHMLQCA